MTPSRLDNGRIDRLLRSLVGVADVSLILTREGKLRSVAILRDGNVQEHQLVRNVLSGLKAGFGLKLEPTDVQVVLHEDAWRQREAEADRRRADESSQVPPPAEVPAKPPVQVTVNGVPVQPNGNGHAAPAVHIGGQATNRVTPPRANGKSTGNGNGASAQSGFPEAYDRQPVEPPRATAPARAAVQPPVEPQLDSIEVERHGAALRCRVAVRVGDRTYAAVAEVRDAPTAEAELAARVTLDALRAGGLSNARLDGIVLTTIADTVYVVTAVRTSATAVPGASAAPLLRNIATAAATAVLRAHGPIGTAEPRAALNGTK